MTSHRFFMSRCTSFAAGTLILGLFLTLAWPDKEVEAQRKKGQTGLGNLKVLPEFEATLFAEPPAVNYPTCLAAAPTGELFVGVDQNGSLDAKSGRGKILRLIDTKGVGK